MLLYLIVRHYLYLIVFGIAANLLRHESSVELNTLKVCLSLSSIEFAFIETMLPSIRKRYHLCFDSTYLFLFLYISPLGKRA